MEDNRKKKQSPRIRDQIKNQGLKIIRKLYKPALSFVGIQIVVITFFAIDNIGNIKERIPLAKKYMISRGLAAEKFVYLPNGIRIIKKGEENNELIFTDNRLINARDEGKLVIGYAGSHGLANNLAPFVEASSKSNDNL